MQGKREGQAMMDDIRNAYGFPLIAKLEAAKIYAAQAKERNKPQHQCDACREREMLPAVIQLLERWQV